MLISRRAMLKLLMGCLALLAVTGVAGVVVGQWDFMGRVMATCFGGAVAAGLMMRASGWIDQPARRRVGLWAMWLAVIQFAFYFFAVWTSSFLGHYYRLEERLWLTLFFVMATGWWSVRFVAALEKPDQRRAARLGLAIDAIVMFLLMVAVWSDWNSGNNWFNANEKLVATAAVLAGAGLTACGCLIGWGPGDRQYGRWMGVIASTLFAVGAIVGIWEDLGGKPTVLTILASIGLFVAFANVLLLAPLRGSQNIFRTLTIVVAGLSLMLVDLLVWNGIDRIDSIAGRLALAGLLLTICGTLAIIVLARLNRGLGDHPALPGTFEKPEIVLPNTLAWTCPLCQKKQTTSTGLASCSGCGLLIESRLTLPRCAACGYLLLHRQAGPCPECGSLAGPEVRTMPASAEAQPVPTPPAAAGPVGASGPTGSPS